MVEVHDRLGRFGVWRRVTDITPEFAVWIEQLGFSTLWVGGSPPADLLAVSRLLEATDSLMIATGVVNVWNSDVSEVAGSFTRIEADHPGRFLLGVGAGHRESTERYRKPYETLTAYVEGLRAGGVPAESLMLAALGPKMLALAGARTVGAHTYLVPPEHTRRAREVLPQGALLAPEQKVVIELDPRRARAIARPRVQRPYLQLKNYTENLRRLGWTDLDLAAGGSDKLIDALVAHGSAEQVAGRLWEHLDAGANHVAVQLLTETQWQLRPSFSLLAEALGFRN